MNTQNIIKLVPLALAVSAALLGCKPSTDITAGDTLLTCDVPLVPNQAGTSCVEPEPLTCPVPTIPDALNESCIVGYDPLLPAPVYTPKENESVFYYNRPSDKAYEGYRLHTWNNDACDSLADESIAESWANGLNYSGVDPNYGAYWILKLKPDYADCANVLVHIGTDDAGKDLGGDKKINLVQDDALFVRMNFTISKSSDLYEYPLLGLGEADLAIEDSAAHLLDANTLIWDIDTSAVSQVKIHHSPYGIVRVDRLGAVTGDTVEFSLGSLSTELAELVPHINSWPAFTSNSTLAEAKSIVKNQLVAVAYDADDKPIKATYVQHAKALDALFTQTENDADEAKLGVIYENGSIISKVWAPTAQKVSLKVYDENKLETATHEMDYDDITGIWSYEGGSELDRQFYRFEVKAYHPISKKVQTTTATDPYSVSLAMNGEYSQFVNLDDTDLKPADWDTHNIPTVANPEDAVLLEGHIRDFSILDDTVSAENRGKYLAFTETDSNAVQYLKRMADSGVTHFHMLPANDIASIQENPELRIDLDSTVETLCERIPNLTECLEFNGAMTIHQVLKSYDVKHQATMSQKLIASINNLDGFNWGYDPHHFNAPEGSYASNPDGVSRIKEMREMNKALHDLGYRVVLDVVYNHTAESGLNNKSVLDKLVPGYYHRYNPVSGEIERSTCCENTATENRMMDKFVVDSLVHWAQVYKFDSFRFDIMGHMPKSTILDARDAVAAIDPDTYFYGEGWNWGEVENNRLFVQAVQDNLAGTEIGTFNDRPRDYIRSAELFKTDGDLEAQDHIRLGLAGTLAEFVLKSARDTDAKGSAFGRASYAKDPADIINYISKHDNETLWDQLQYGLASDLSLSDRVRAHSVSASIPVLSQGIPFFQLGVDMMRSKSMDRDSYNSGDWFNFIDYTMQTNNWNIGLPSSEKNEAKWDNIGTLLSSIATPGYNEIKQSSDVFAEFLKIRNSSPLFKLTTEQDIIARVGFHNIGKNQTQGLIVMSMDDGADLADLDPNYDAIVVVINATNQTQSHSVLTAQGFELHTIQQNSADTLVQDASFVSSDEEGTFTVPALTTAVFVKPQGDAQGSGLSALATQGAPDVVPYGDETVYLRGDMNGWSTDSALKYMGNGVYQVVVALTGGQTYGFKFADADWGSRGINFGGAEAGDGIVTAGTTKDLFSTNTNLSFTPDIDASYVFTFDASSKDAPTLNIVNEEPFVGTPVYLRGDMNGWGTTDELIYQGGRIYTLATDLTAGSYGFKIASSDWSTVDLGAAADTAIDLSGELALAAKGSNMSFTLAADTSVIFIFDMTTLAEPKLRVFKQEFFNGVQAYIRGGMNGWGTANPLNYNGDGTYSTDIDLATGEHEFKVASEDWSTIDLGGLSADEAATYVDTAEKLTFKGANLKVTIETAGTYTFTIVGPDGSAPSLTVTAAD
ncbi:alpha-1,6-glucosidase domain-containing protein [Catenovulum maritimum]|uniref:Pullulanase n=1 Tax=Catenovulum maritimum TaxID=1513271 RepID=A0A0J8GLT0_9ALTE|nr:alpha-1,6-glucosidase domain-containing protein [Catenovulum maritimum]KMT63777.1 pullulanase [Catenovulum maritimum]